MRDKAKICEPTDNCKGIIHSAIRSLTPISHHPHRCIFKFKHVPRKILYAYVGKIMRKGKKKKAQLSSSKRAAGDMRGPPIL